MMRGKSAGVALSTRQSERRLGNSGRKVARDGRTNRSRNRPRASSADAKTRKVDADVLKIAQRLQGLPVPDLVTSVSAKRTS